MDARFQVKNQGRIVKNPNCKVCTGAPIVEIECIMCHKTQGLEEFSKVQRKNPSNAVRKNCFIMNERLVTHTKQKCYKCIEDQVSLDAVNDEKYEDPLKAFTTPDHSGGRIPEYFTSSTASTDDSFSTIEDDDSATSYGSRSDLNGGIALSNNFHRVMSISDDVEESLIETEYAFPPAPATDGGWSEIRAKSWHTKSAIPSSSGFHPNKYGNPRASTGSVSSRSMHSFASSQAERSEVLEIRASGFAKIRAVSHNIEEIHTELQFESKLTTT